MINPLPFRIDLGRAAFAVALSVILYVFALRETNPEQVRETDFAIPVEVVNVPAGLVVVDRPPPVKLRVRAPIDVLNRLRPESFTALADASNARAGEQDLLVSVRPTDPDVRDVTSVPARVRLRLEDVQERTLPVRVNISGQVPTGYQLGQPRADPARLTVSGASGQVSKAYEAVVDVNVERVTVSVNAVFTPRVVDERGNELKDLSVRPPAVNVQVPIVQQAQFKEVGVRPKLDGQPAQGYLLQQVEVDPPTVTLVGEPSALEGVSFAETELVDVKGIASTAVRRVAVTPPSQTLLVQPGQTVLVTVKVAPLTITQTVRVQPTVLDLAANLELVKPPDPVSITITGPAPTLSGLSGKDFRVVLELGGKGPGRYDVEPKVQNLPQGMSVDRIEPRTLSVELRELPPSP